MSKTSLTSAVDKLGHINAQIADLQAQAEPLREQLLQSNKPEVEGKLFRVVLSERTSKRLVSAKVRKYLTARQLKACTNEVTSTVLTIYDR